MTNIMPISRLETLKVIFLNAVPFDSYALTTSAELIAMMNMKCEYLIANAMQRSWRGKEPLK